MPDDRPLWGRLPPGPYAVGYQACFQRDYARSYPLSFPECGRTPASKQPRPLLVNIWYPASTNVSAQPLCQGDYLQIACPEGTLASFAQRLAAFHQSASCQSVTGKSPAQLDPEERAAYERFLQTPTAAVKDAAPTGGYFPLVLNHQGYGGTFDDNTVLFEFLASHGYVVANSAFQPEEAARLSINHDLRRSHKDLAFLLHSMLGHPQVDMEHIGVMGHSYGAQAVLAWVAEEAPAVEAVVSLDTTLEYVPLDQEEVRIEGGIRVNQSLRDVRTRFEAAPHLSTPLLILTQARLGPDFSLYARLPQAERYYAQVDFVEHQDFVSLVAASRRKEDTWEGYIQVCQVVLCFLDAYLKENVQAQEYLRRGGEALEAVVGGYRGQERCLLSWQYEGVSNSLTVRKSESPLGR